MLILTAALIICFWWFYTFFFIMKSQMHVVLKVMTSVFASVFGFFASVIILYMAEALSKLI